MISKYRLLFMFQNFRLISVVDKGSALSEGFIGARYVFIILINSIILINTRERNEERK